MKLPLINPKSSIEDIELQKLITFYNETLGFCPNSIKTMHIRPKIAIAFIELNRAVMENNGKVTSALKRLIGFISSFHAGCNYCQAHTIRAAERYDAQQEQMENIWNYKTHPSFSEAERAALDLAVAATAIPNGVNDDLAEYARKYWNEGELVEIMGVIALFGFLNRWNDSIGTEIEKGAQESGKKYLSPKGWTTGKHSY